MNYDLYVVEVRGVLVSYAVSVSKGNDLKVCLLPHQM